jgi:Fe-S-cluster-containing hydrogenase component 2
MAPFIPGFYEEYMATTRDMEVLHLMWHYAHEGALEIAGFRPALHRVIPALKSLDAEQILPYDDVRTIIMAAKSFAAFDCTCRLTRDMEGNRPCSFPVHNCLQMFYERRAPGPGTISRRRALEILDEAEDLGLVHTGTNYIREVHWICNCCGCCCNLIRNLVEEGLDGAIARANYRAFAARGACTACGACVNRCPVKAIRLDGGECLLEASRCIGCGLCVTGCPVGALALRRREPGDIRHPPLDEDDFAKRRFRGRQRSAKRQP